MVENGVSTALMHVLELVPNISKVDDPNVEDKDKDTRQYATCTGCIMTI